MKKTTLILSIVTLGLALFEAILFGVTLSRINDSSDGWANLVLMIFAVGGLFATVILTLPFIFILKKEGMNQVKFYFYTHIGFFILVIAMFIVGLISA